MAEMTREQRKGAIAALEAINVCSDAFQSSPTTYIHYACLEHRVQIAAMPPEPDLRAALVEARAALVWQLIAIDEGFITADNDPRTQCTECDVYSTGDQSTIIHGENCASGNARAAVARIDAALAEVATCKS